MLQELRCGERGRLSKPYVGYLVHPFLKRGREKICRQQ
jgi:hypothetical protein